MGMCMSEQKMKIQVKQSVGLAKITIGKETIKVNGD